MKYDFIKVIEFLHLHWMKEYNLEKKEVIIMTRTGLEQKIEQLLRCHNEFTNCGTYRDKDGNITGYWDEILIEDGKKNPGSWPIVLRSYNVNKTIDEICDFIMDNKNKLITADEVVSALMYRIDDMKKEIEDLKKIVYKNM